MLPADTHHAFFHTFYFTFCGLLLIILTRFFSSSLCVFCAVYEIVQLLLAMKNQQSKWMSSSIQFCGNILEIIIYDIDLKLNKFALNYFGDGDKQETYSGEG